MMNTEKQFGVLTTKEEIKMIRIEKLEVFGWEAAVRGMRNPMNSWDKGDSGYVECNEYKFLGDVPTYKFKIGENDLNLMKRLVAAGTDHSKFMRMINVTCDITAPLYWWKEFDTYKVGTVANSCSTMHKIHEKEFTLDDFSHEHLSDKYALSNANDPLNVMEHIIYCLNFYRNLYIKTKDKKYWWQMIQLLPSSYNQKRTVQLNYAVLRNMYHSRKNHKLDEWRNFCAWVEGLPYSELITMKDGGKE